MSENLPPGPRSPHVRTPDKRAQLNERVAPVIPQSILEVHEYSFSGSYTGNFFTTDWPLAFDVPSNPSFDYYLEWDMSGHLWRDPGCTGSLEFAGFAQILEQSPGAGFEVWGWRESIPDDTTSVSSGFGRFNISGHGHRVEHVASELLGTTIHLQIYRSLSTAGNTGQFQIAYSGKLLAVAKTVV